ncbi:MAG: hypothetical protein PQJ58_09420 [Spirochaetales bacterium]|nr:hypothetical protein [Spirochaetales bacterium]
MVSNSSIFMPRAVILSLLFHALVLLLMSFYFTLTPQPEVFPAIRISFTRNSFPDGGLKNTPEAGKSDTKVSEPVLLEPRDVLTPVQEIPVSPEPPVPVPSVPEVSVPEASIPELSAPEQPVLEQSVPEQPVPEPSVLEPVVPEETIIQETPPRSEAAQVAEPVRTSSAAQISTASQTAEPVQTSGTAQAASGEPGADSEDQSELQWEGAPAVRRYVPDPDFRIPLNVHLPDVIEVSFSVKYDGTVRVGSIKPPTGSLSLDSQIRQYVNDFLFESFDRSEADRKGLLRLNLRGQEAG